MTYGNFIEKMRAKKNRLLKSVCEDEEEMYERLENMIRYFCNLAPTIDFDTVPEDEQEEAYRCISLASDMLRDARDLGTSISTFAWGDWRYDYDDFNGVCPEFETLWYELENMIYEEDGVL